MDCPGCGHTNQEGQKFCGECGGKLPAPGPVACPSCRAEHPPGQKFCGECGTKLGGASSASPGPSAIQKRRPTLEAQLPASALPHSTAGPPLPRGERKVVTVMFADVSGFTAMSEKLDPEEVTLIMNRCFEALGAPISKHDGVIDKFIGDCVMALFGAPVAHEDDPERACRAAIEMQEALSELNARLPIALAVNIGINSGIVVAGEVGTEGKRDYTVMGDAVNTAQRIQSAAKGGQIYVSQSVWRPTESAFDYEELPPIRAKGKEQPVPVFRLKGHRREDRSAHRTGPRTPLIGRETELGRISERLGRAVGGQGSAIALIGEAGIGKTRLRAETTRRAAEAGMAVAVGRGFDHRRELPFGPALELVRRLFGVGDGDGREEVRRKVEEGLPDLALSAHDRAALARDLGALSDAAPAGAATESKAARFAPFLELFRALCSRGPALLVFEDLHWADPLTLELLSLTCDETLGRPLVVVMTSRPATSIPQGVRAPTETLVLEELPFLDARRLLHHLLANRPIAAELEEAILRRAEGNPFFLEELVFSLGPSATAANVTALPDTVQAVVAARIDRLGEEAKWLLQSASILGRNFPVPLLERVSERTRITPMLELLEREALIYSRPGDSPPSWSFRQAITQEVAYGSLLKQTARPMHLRAARGIEELHRERLEERFSELARHFSLGAEPASAVRYGLLAAEADRRAFALAKAAELYVEALATLAQMATVDPFAPAPRLARTTGAFVPAAVPPPGTIDRWLLTVHYGLGEVRRILGRWDQARESFEEALTRARATGERIGECENALCRLAFLRGDFDEARRRGEESMAAAAGRGDLAAEAEAANLVGNVADRQGNRDDAERLLRRSAELFAAAGQPRGEAWALADLGTALLHAGRLDESLDVQERSLAGKRQLSDRLGIAASLVNLGNIHGARGEHESSIARFEEALEIYRVVGDRKGVAGTLSNLSIAEQELMRLDSAAKRNAAALEIQLSIGDVPNRAISLLQRGAIARMKCDYHLAADSCREADELFSSIGYRMGQAAARGNLGEILFEGESANESHAPLADALGEFRALGDDDTSGEIDLYLAAAEALTGAGTGRLHDLVAAAGEGTEPGRRSLAVLLEAVVAARSGNAGHAAELRSRAMEFARQSAAAWPRHLVERLLPPATS